MARTAEEKDIARALRARPDERRGARPATGAPRGSEQPGRVVIEHVRPQVDCGSRPARTTVGDLLTVEADVFADGHDRLRCEVRYRHETDGRWTTTAMHELGNDRWRARIPVLALGSYRFVVRGEPDPFATWARDLRARLEAGQDIALEAETGAGLVATAAEKARGRQRRALKAIEAHLRECGGDLSRELPAGDPALEVRLRVGEHAGATLGEIVFSGGLSELAGRLTAGPATNSPTFSVRAEPAKARYSTWYEMFPRSASAKAGRHGTFADVRARLGYVEEMGFDVLYLPPIHPVGLTGRKGKNGATSAGEDDPGSPWAIGSAEGGHTSIDPRLGTLEEFRALVADAGGRGIDIALDVAFQTSPDHPWVTEHPSWFRHRPDGTIRHAENPPKKYEDIYPIDFDTDDWPALWSELLGVVRYWIDQGVKVFRVDNPHTKPFAFWEWLLGEVRGEAPEVIFLSEAFTRPRVMEQLAKVGFSQSYTYFAWRSSKWDLTSYLTELTRSEVADYFRPNLWPNTPDILTEELQRGGRAAFLSRLVLAATLGSSYGVYGPAFELQEHTARAVGSEEYAASEKYEVRSWDIARPDSLASFVGLVNGIRREHEALHFNDALVFHDTDNEQIMCYSKTRPVSSRVGPLELEETGELTPGEAMADAHGLGSDVIVTVVSLDHVFAQAGWVYLDLGALGVDQARPYVMHDLLTDARYVWQGARNFVRLDPAEVPCHIFSLEQQRPAPPELRREPER